MPECTQEDFSVETQLHWLFPNNRQNNNNFKFHFMTGAATFMLLVRNSEQVKSHANWCAVYDYNPTRVHLNFVQN